VGTTNNRGFPNNKKISKESYRLSVRFFTDLQPFVKSICKRKGLTQVDLISKLLLEYLIQEAPNQNYARDMLDSLEQSKDLNKLNIHSKTKMTKEDIDRIGKRVIEDFKILGRTNPEELLNLERLHNYFFKDLKKRYDTNAGDLNLDNV
jgi:hypothetical protein